MTIENPTAFPASADNYGNFLKGTPGMTLRDYFAGQALAGIIAADNSPAGDWPLCAEHAYKAADAMLAARKGPDHGRG